MDTSALQDEKCFPAVLSNKNHSWGKVCASMIIGLSSQIDFFDLLAGGRVKNSVHFCNWLKIIQGRVDLGIKAAFTGLHTTFVILMLSNVMAAFQIMTRNTRTLFHFNHAQTTHCIVQCNYVL